MKLKKRLKGVADLKRGPLYLSAAERTQMSPQQREAFDTFASRHNAEQARRSAAKTPEECKAAGVAFTGVMPDKGKKDGSCNRSACQMPLAGRPQFWMKDHMTGGRLYYCGPCEREFTRWDRRDRPGEPLRCTPDEANETLPEEARYW